MQIFTHVKKKLNAQFNGLFVLQEHMGKHSSKQKKGASEEAALSDISDYRKDSCISRTFLLKFQAKNHGCGLYRRPLFSQGVNWLVGVLN